MTSVESVVKGYFDGLTLLVSLVHRDPRRGIRITIYATVKGKEYVKYFDPDELIKLRLALGITFNDMDTSVAARKRSACECATKSLLPALAQRSKCKVELENEECVVTFRFPVQDYGEMKGQFKLNERMSNYETLNDALSEEVIRLNGKVAELGKKLKETEELLDASKTECEKVKAALCDSIKANSGTKRAAIADSGGTPLEESSDKKLKHE